MPVPDASQDDPRLNEILAAYLLAAESGAPPDREQLLRAHPEYARELGEFFADKSQIDKLAGMGSPVPADARTLPPKSVTRLDAPTLDSTPAVAAAIRPGAIVRYFGDYELLEEIARGGMGVVYKARQVKLNRIVALKMILSGQLASEQDVQRFYTEAEAAAGLDHRGIVPIIEVGDHQGQHFFSMGYVEGESLAARLAGGPLPPRQAAELVRKVTEAVQYAHEHGVIHRDLKPANVLLARGERQLVDAGSSSSRSTSGDSRPPLAEENPKVTDFGLAKKLESDSNLTGTGQILGTPSYMPPEQAAGRVNEIRETADIYSLGAVLYATLTGRPPFQADNPLDTLMQVLEREPVAPRQLNPAVPKDLETICLKCLEKDPRRRYASAGGLAEELTRYLDGRPILARPAGPVERAWRWCRRNPRIASLSAALMFVLCVATVVSASFAFSEHAAKRDAIDAREAESRQKVLAQEREAEAKAAKNAEAQQRQLAERREAEAKTARDEEAEQRKLAETARQAEAKERAAAEAARRLAERQRKLAEKSEKEARWHLYGARLHPMVSAWQNHEFGQLERLLKEAIPKAGEPDFRGWEWYYLRDQARQHSVSLSEEVKFEKQMDWHAATGRLAVVVAGRIELWDPLQRERRLSIADAPPGGVMELRFSPDGKQLACGSRRGEVYLFDTETGRIAHRIEAHTDGPSRTWITALAWRPDGKVLASACWRGDIKLWDPATGKPDSTLLAPEQEVFTASLAWHPDGKLLACGQRSSRLRLFDTQTRRLLWTKGHSDANDTFRALAWSPDGSILASGKENLFLWDHEGKQLAAFPTKSLESVVWLDNERLVSTGNDMSVVEWNVRERKEARRLQPHFASIHQVVSFGDGERVITSSADARILIHQLHATPRQATAVEGHEANVMRIAWSPDDKQLISAVWDGTVRIWDATNHQAVATLSGQEKYLNDAAWSPDGRQIASIGAAVGAEAQLIVWDAATQQVIVTKKKIATGNTGLAWHPSGKQLIVGGSSSHLAALRTDTWEEDARFGDAVGTGFAFSPGGARLLAATYSANVYDTATGRFITTLKTRVNGVRNLAWSPSGKLIAIPSAATIAVVNAFGFQEIHRLQGHGGLVRAVAFSPDERRLASASEDGTVRVWDAATGDLLLTLVIPGCIAAIDVAWSHDGRRLASGTDDGRVGRIVLWGSPDMPALPAKIDYLEHGILAAVKAPETELQELSAAIEEDPTDANRWISRGDYYGRRQQWKEAAADFARPIELQLKNANRALAAMAALMAGDDSSYQEHCQVLQRHLKAESHPWNWQITARTCALRPNMIENPDSFLENVRRVAKNGAKEWPCEDALVAVLYRLGHYDEAAEVLPRCEPLAWGWHTKAVNKLWSALVSHQQGKPDQAQTALLAATALIDANLPPAGEPVNAFHILTEMLILRREAEQLILESASPASPASAADTTRGN